MALGESRIIIHTLSIFSCLNPHSVPVILGLNPIFIGFIADDFPELW
jgi:hypothetical protein